MKILITKDAKIVITEAEAEKVFNNMPGSKFIVLNGQMIQVAFISGLFDLDFYIKQEADTLKLKYLRRCKKCGEILDRKGVCPCKDNPELRENHLFKIDDQKLLK